jgi:hypothetical protein
MKISIESYDMSGCGGLNIYANGKKLRNQNAGFIKPFDFDETEIQHLLEPSQFKKFEGGAYEFDVPKWKLDVVSGLGLKNATRAQNIFSYEYEKLNSPCTH